MSEIRVEGKDTIIFATKKDHATPSTIILPEPEQPPGLVLEDGSINWNCPCLGDMTIGPCGVQFREAFSCYHYSTAENKGTECVEVFIAMQTCMMKYPTVYGPMDETEESKLGLDKVEDVDNSNI